jgi:hypothetical protein
MVRTQAIEASRVKRVAERIILRVLSRKTSVSAVVYGLVDLKFGLVVLEQP